MALYNHSIQMGEKSMRVLRFPLIRLVIAFSIFGVGLSLANVIVGGLENLVSEDAADSWVGPFFQMLLQCGFALLGYWIFVSLFDGRPTTELSKAIIKNSALGIFLGVVFISLIMGVLALLGYYKIDGLNSSPDIFKIFLMAILAGVVEEIMLRGYFFRIVEEGLGTWISVAISALLFGFLHAGNPNASWVSSVSIALTAGVILALLFVLTRNLWIVIGMHFAWNFTLGGIYSAPVSGGAAKGFFNGTLDGSEILTGGDFGPEASVITVGIFCLFGVYLIVKTIQSKQVVKPFWRRGNV